MECHEATERDTTKIEHDPEMMQSVEKHQEILTEGAAVMAVGELTKRCKVQNLAMEHRQKRKKRTRETHESRRKLAVARRKVTPCAKVVCESS
jgi:hypothetical protein